MGLPESLRHTPLSMLPEKARGGVTSTSTPVCKLLGPEATQGLCGSSQHSRTNCMPALGSPPSLAGTVYLPTLTKRNPGYEALASD